MNRRGFLAALGAISAGLALRSVPVLGETFSLLVPPRVFAAAAPGRRELVVETGYWSAVRFVVSSPARPVHLHYAPSGLSEAERVDLGRSFDGRAIYLPDGEVWRPVGRVRTLSEGGGILWDPLPLTPPEAGS